LGCARDFHTALRQTALQFPDLFQPLFISISDEGVDTDAAGGGGGQFLLDLEAVEAVEYEPFPLFRPADPFRKQLDAVAWLNNNLHYDSNRSLPLAVPIRYLAAA